MSNDNLPPGRIYLFILEHTSPILSHSCLSSERLLRAGERVETLQKKTKRVLHTQTCVCVVVIRKMNCDGILLNKWV